MGLGPDCLPARLLTELETSKGAGLGARVLIFRSRKRESLLPQPTGVRGVGFLPKECGVAYAGITGAFLGLSPHHRR